MKVQFPAEQIPSGIMGELRFNAKERIPEIGSFLKDYKKRLAEKPQYLYVTMEVLSRPRTLKQNNLQWELCTRISASPEIGATPELIHSAVKEQFYPREECFGIFAPKDGKDLTTVEYAQVIEQLIVLCAENGVDIKDIWVLWTDWRFQQEIDPLVGTYSSLSDYREKHPCCEACGDYLAEASNAAHLVSKGAGAPADFELDGKFDDRLVIILCDQHHRGVQHQKGWDELFKIAPWLQTKWERAHKILGAAEETILQEEAEKDIQPPTAYPEELGRKETEPPYIESLKRMKEAEHIADYTPEHDSQKELEIY